MRLPQLAACDQRPAKTRPTIRPRSGPGAPLHRSASVWMPYKRCCMRACLPQRLHAQNSWASAMAAHCTGLECLRPATSGVRLREWPHAWRCVACLGPRWHLDSFRRDVTSSAYSGAGGLYRLHPPEYTLRRAVRPGVSSCVAMLAGRCSVSSPCSVEPCKAISCYAASCRLPLV